MFIVFASKLNHFAFLLRSQSMIEAFERGGCFHSRTAMGMYPHVRKAVDSGKVLLEWDYKKVGTLHSLHHTAAAS